MPLFGAFLRLNPVFVTGRLIFCEDYNDCSTAIKMGTYYMEFPSISKQYKNVIYLSEIQYQRSNFEVNVTEDVDELGITRETSRISIERVTIDIIANSNLLAYFNSIGAHSNIKLEIFEDTTNPSDTTLYSVDKVEFSDKTTAKQVTGQISLTLDLIPEIDRACCDEEITVLSDYLAFWDIDDDGVADINASADDFNVSSTVGAQFEVWQLYFESDGITPLASGDVVITAIGIDKNGDRFVLGEFSGVFGDLLSDSSKWTSSYNLWDYFGLTDSIGHTNRVRFAKKTFAFDQGFYGNETKDSAIAIELNIQVNDSPAEPVTLEEMYSVLSSYCNNTNPQVTANTRQVTLNKSNEQVDLVDYDETRTRLSDSTPFPFSAFSLLGVNSYRKSYYISPSSLFESYSTINSETLAGLTSTQLKGADGVDDFFIGGNTGVSNVVSQITGYLGTLTTRQCTFFYQTLAETSGGATWPTLGTFDTTLGEWFFDGVSQGFFNTSLVNNSQSMPTIAQNQDVHTVKFKGETTTGYEISLEFQYRLYKHY